MRLTSDDECASPYGAEIAAIVPEAMFAAFADGGREITTEDLIAARIRDRSRVAAAPETSCLPMSRHSISGNLSQ